MPSHSNLGETCVRRCPGVRSPTGLKYTIGGKSLSTEFDGTVTRKRNPHAGDSGAGHAGSAGDCGRHKALDTLETAVSNGPTQYLGRRIIKSSSPLQPGAWHRRVPRNVQQDKDKLSRRIVFCPTFAAFGPCSTGRERLVPTESCVERADSIALIRVGVWQMMSARLHICLSPLANS